MHWFMFSMYFRWENEGRFEDFFQDTASNMLYSHLEKDFEPEEYGVLVEDLKFLNSNFFQRYQQLVISFLIPNYRDFVQYKKLCKEGWGEVLFEQLSESARKEDGVVSSRGLKKAFASCTPKTKTEAK
jgi:hypothetical protein